MQAILAEEYCSVQTPQPSTAAVHDFAWQATSQQPCQPESGSQLAAGLQNSAGEFNCFLNVIIQCLWYCSCFRTAVMAWPPSVYQVWHVHLQIVFLEACSWGLYLGTVSGICVWEKQAFGSCFLLLLRHSSLTIVMIITTTSDAVVVANMRYSI